MQQIVQRSARNDRIQFVNRMDAHPHRHISQAPQISNGAALRRVSPLIRYFELRPNKPSPSTGKEEPPQKTSLQLRVLRFGFLQNGDVGVGVFPEREEVLVSGFRFGGIA
jgi:hypothetical protein